MSALDEYYPDWDRFLETHRQPHGENHVPTRDFNCCGEYAVLMALRAASSLKPDYPERLLLRMAAMPELDRDFYVKNLLSTDGEPEPSDPEPLREYRASRRYHILWSELTEAAATAEPRGAGHHAGNRPPARCEAGPRGRLHAQDRDRRIEHIGVPAVRARGARRTPRGQWKANRSPDDPPRGRRRAQTGGGGS